MAIDRLRAEASLNAAPFETGAKKVEKATGRMSNKIHDGRSPSSAGRPGQRSANNAVVNLTRLTQDAKYGMPAIANNIQVLGEDISRLVSQSGSFGKAMVAFGNAFKTFGIILIITAITTYWPEIKAFFQNMASEADKTSAKVKEVFSAISSDISGDIGSLQYLVDAYRNASTDAEKLKYHTELVKAGWDSTNDSLDEFLKKQKTALINQALLAKGGELYAEAIEKGFEAQAKLTELKSNLAEFNEKFGTNLSVEDVLGGEERVREVLGQNQPALSAYRGSLFGFDLKGLGEDYLDLLGESKNILESTSGILKEVKGILESALGTGDAITDDNGDIPIEFGGKGSQGKEKVKIFGDIENNALAAQAAITGLQSALSNLDDNPLKSFAQSAIKVLQSLAFAQAITAATADSVKFGAVALPALIGVALGVVGSAFSSNVKGAGGGGSVSRGASPSVTPTSIQGSGHGMGHTIIRADQIRYMTQVSSDNYSAKN